LRIREKDIEMLQWINGFGFAGVEHISKYLSKELRLTKRRLGQLQAHGYIVAEKIFHEYSSVYRLTPKAVSLIGDSITALPRISPGVFRHDYMMLDLSLWLSKETAGHIMPARRIRHHQGLSVREKYTHIADGYLFCENNKKPIAIELELSVKSAASLNKVIEYYGSNLDVSHVHYYTNRKDVAHAVSKAAKGYEFIKIMDIPKEVCF
jgi:hypothetical protein